MHVRTCRGDVEGESTAVKEATQINAPHSELWTSAVFWKWQKIVFARYPDTSKQCYMERCLALEHNPINVHSLTVSFSWFSLNMVIYCHLCIIIFYQINTSYSETGHVPSSGRYIL